MKIVTDTWRAVLVVAVVTVLRAAPPSGETEGPRPEKREQQQPAAPAAWSWQQAGGAAGPPVYNIHQPPALQPQQIIMQSEPKRPLRRVAAAMTDLGDALIGVVR